ncbi:eb5d3017-3451-4623-94b3-2364b51c45a7 [Thermothielavioides terrestris]|uniref:Eb5d3017-3451-4623-94b3-2364b51c45a7 n=1 Tax=Thermothielavioides terrestris TaxID=2587410 RepID=A0A446BPG6_9PEZI|nr:eb5d3017-3451-4623-94b3-2364b51c45a7 [Thermothielavioides terrestris]
MAVPPESVNLVWALSVLTFFTAIFVGLHIYGKWKHDRPIAKDGYCLVAAEVFLVTSLILVAVAVRFGYGQRVEDLKYHPIEAIRLVAVSQFFTCGAAALAKTSITFPALKLAANDLLKLIPVVALTVFANFFGWLSAVIVPLGIWGLRVEGTCSRHLWMLGLALLSAYWSVVTDIGFAILPWFLVPLRDMRAAEKIGLGVATSLGIFAAAVAGVRINKYLGCNEIGLDVSANSVPLVIWTFVESAVIIIAASIPALRFVIRCPTREWVLRTWFGRRRGYEANPDYSRFFFPSPRFRREPWSRGWTVLEGGSDTSISLDTLDPREDDVVRMTEVRVSVEEVTFRTTREVALRIPTPSLACYRTGRSQMFFEEWEDDREDETPAGSWGTMGGRRGTSAGRWGTSAGSWGTTVGSWVTATSSWVSSHWSGETLL